MQIEFYGISDFIRKRIDLFKMFDEMKEGIESKLGNVSEKELLNVSDTDIGRYFLLKDLLEDNQTFIYGVPDSSHEGEAKISRNLENIISLDIRAFRKNEKRILDFLREAYKSLPGEKETWLIGEDTEKRVGEEYEYNDQFNTKKIIEGIGFADSLVLVDGDKGPRSNYDQEIYQRFISKEGFNPVGEFCTRFPHQFFQAIVITPEGELYLEPERRRHAGWDVKDYSVRIILKSANGENFEEVGDMVDKYLVAA